MLSVSNYDQAYVATCRERIGAQIAAFDDLARAARDAAPNDGIRLGAALEAFEPGFFNHMVMALDCYFGHRGRNIEGKDGNPLNEVRVLCTSMMHNGGRFAADTQIKLKPEESCLGYAVGDTIALSRSDFATLSDAFFAEIERRYT